MLPVLTPSPASAATTFTLDAGQQSIVDNAVQFSGARYARGGNGPSRFDCSGYTRFVYSMAGKWLPRDSRAQRAYVPRIHPGDATPGDLVFFHDRRGRVYHVGIYAGNGALFHASRPGTPVGWGRIFSSNISFGRV